MINGVYLCYGNNVDYNIKNVAIDYVDLYVKNPIIKNKDCVAYLENINLNDIDFIISTPPCNYYSRANYRRDISQYSLATKHLLPYFINKLPELNKPFLIENVINDNLQVEFLYKCYSFKHGRHRYWTNIKFDLPEVQKTQPIKYMSTKKRQGDINVHNVIIAFIKEVKKLKK